MNQVSPANYRDFKEMSTSFAEMGAYANDAVNLVGGGEPRRLAIARLNLEVKPLLGVLWFTLKTYLFVAVAVWLRGTLPRVRVDQLMGMAWKVLLPLALVNLFITAIAVVVFDL